LIIALIGALKHGCSLGEQGHGGLCLRLLVCEFGISQTTTNTKEFIMFKLFSKLAALIGVLYIAYIIYTGQFNLLDHGIVAVFTLAMALV